MWLGGMVVLRLAGAVWWVGCLLSLPAPRTLGLLFSGAHPKNPDCYWPLLAYQLIIGAANNSVAVHLQVCVFTLILLCNALTPQWSVTARKLH